VRARAGGLFLMLRSTTSGFAPRPAIKETPGWQATIPAMPIEQIVQQLRVERDRLDFICVALQGRCSTFAVAVHLPQDPLTGIAIEGGKIPTPPVGGAHGRGVWRTLPTKVALTRACGHSRARRSPCLCVATCGFSLQRLFSYSSGNNAFTKGSVNS
jgi:hypothetical protein